MTSAVASAVPRIVGVVVPIVAPLVGVVTTGAAGATESIVKLLLVELADVPPALDAVACTVFTPCGNATPGVKLQAPPADATTCPACVPLR